MSAREHIFENAVHLDEYPKDFIVLSKPTKKGVAINVSYKGRPSRVCLFVDFHISRHMLK